MDKANKTTDLLSYDLFLFIIGVLLVINDNLSLSYLNWLIYMMLSANILLMLFTTLGIYISHGLKIKSNKKYIVDLLFFIVLLFMFYFGYIYFALISGIIFVINNILLHKKKIN